MKMRDTPWGQMTYIDYKKKIEFNEEEICELIEFSKYIKIVIFTAFQIPVEYRKDIKFNYLSLGCNGLEPNSTVAMEHYDMHSSPESFGDDEQAATRRSAAKALRNRNDIS